jgi:hypothetical protein
VHVSLLTLVQHVDFEEWLHAHLSVAITTIWLVTSGMA